MEQYVVTGMSCAACSSRVEKAVSKVPGVTSCSVSLLTNSMGVEGTASSDAVIAAVKNAGYGASLKSAASKKSSTASASAQEELLEDHDTPVLKRRLLTSLGFLIVLMYFSMGHMMWNWPLPAFYTDNHIAMGLTQMLLTIIVMVINQKFFISGYKSLWHKAPNMDTLVALGSTAAFGYSTYALFAMTYAQVHGDDAAVMSYMHEFYFESAAMILTLITVGKMLEARSKGRTTDALKGLMKLAPKTAVILRNGQEITVPAQIQQPKVNKEALEKVLFRDVLASCTTYVSGAWGRIQNVRKAAQNISGTVLNCGDQFSYNDAIGPTTADYGFYAAPGYVGGKTVDVYGGGVCQVSSTLYYATLKADLEIVMRYCHQYAPGYIKWGCDATVYDGFPDFIFANNTDYPIKIVTYWNDNNVTVEILGTKVDDSYVEMVSETVDVIPWETVYEETDELAPGEKQEIQTPYTGYVVQTWRNVYAGDGSLLSSTFEATSNYESRDQIIRIGKAKP